MKIVRVCQVMRTDYCKRMVWKKKGKQSDWQLMAAFFRIRFFRTISLDPAVNGTAHWLKRGNQKPKRMSNHLRFEGQDTETPHCEEKDVFFLELFQPVREVY